MLWWNKKHLYSERNKKDEEVFQVEENICGLFQPKQ